MAKKDYFPRRDKDFRSWFVNFIAKVRLYAADFGLDPAIIDAWETEGLAYADSIDANESSQASAQQSRAAKDALGDILEPKLRKGIKGIKLTGGYSEARGEDMNVVGDEETFDPDTYKPKLKATIFPNSARIDFVKGNREVEAVNVYSRLKGEAAWEKLGTDYHSPYVDERPLAQPGVPENREYMAIGVKRDMEIGQMSDIVSVVFGG